MTDLKIPQLSDKPSEGIRQAIADLVKVENLPDCYTVEMGQWHEPRNDNGKCGVCLAGAVMAMAGNMPDQLVMPSDFVFSGYRTTEKLQALDKFRIGWTDDALNSYLDSKTEISFGDRIMADYHIDPARFKTDMLQLADDLEKEGY